MVSRLLITENEVRFLTVKVEKIVDFETTGEIPRKN